MTVIIGDMGGEIKKTSQRSSKRGTMAELRVARGAMGATQIIRTPLVLEKASVGREEGRETACRLRRRACRLK